MGLASSAALFDRARDHHALGQLTEALGLFDILAQRHPDVAGVHIGRGDVLLSGKDLAPALAAYEQAILLKPGDAHAYLQKGVVLQLLGRLDEALQSYDCAIARNAGDANAHYSRATALAAAERFEEAIAGYDTALGLKPDFAQGWNNKALALQALKRPHEALACFDRAIALQPDWDILRSNRALCSLLLGRFEEGWQLYEARQRPALPAGLAASGKPVWTGQEALAGKTLLAYGEQGLGDVMQFCRYAAMAEARGATVLLAVPACLVTLLRQSHLRAIDGQGPIDDHDYRIPLLSMPLAFGTDAQSIPAAIPYLFAQGARARSWSERLGPQGFKIGIAWQGDRASAADVGRSIPLRHFAGLAKIAGVRLISLQKNDGTEQLPELGIAVEQLGEGFDAGPDGFVDSAAVMESLDLVITSDTAIAHLAGALGRPVWLALQHVPEWRWQLDRADSPWYPGMRLFRQRVRGDWASVFAQMEAQLPGLVSARRHDKSTSA